MTERKTVHPLVLAWGGSAPPDPSSLAGGLPPPRPPARRARAGGLWGGSRPASERWSGGAEPPQVRTSVFYFANTGIHRPGSGCALHRPIPLGLPANEGGSGGADPPQIRTSVLYFANTGTRPALIIDGFNNRGFKIRLGFWAALKIDGLFDHLA